MRSIKFMTLALSIAILSLFLAPVTASALPEDRLQEALLTEALPYITLHGKYESFPGVNGLAISTFFLPGTNGPKGDVVLVPGQGEFIPKYYELAYDLIQRGYSGVHIIDHRGQGLSPRLLSQEPQKGTVDNFSDYVEDLHRFVKSIREKRPQQKLFLIAHNMGAAVSSLLLSEKYSPKYDSVFTAIAFSSPMFGLKAPIVQDSRRLMFMLKALCKKESSCNAFAPGKANFNVYTYFQGNDWTHSEARWQLHHSQLNETPKVGIHGPTNRWVLEMTRAALKISDVRPPAHTPMLVLQASQDHIVVPGAQLDYCKKSKNCRLIKIPQAKHEILQEADAIRSNVLDLIDQFFSRRP